MNNTSKAPMQHRVDSMTCHYGHHGQVAHDLIQITPAVWERTDSGHPFEVTLDTDEFGRPMVVSAICIECRPPGIEVPVKCHESPIAFDMRTDTPWQRL